MIDSTANEPFGGFMPIISKAAHDYFRSEMGRPMKDFEVKALEATLLDLDTANAELARLGVMAAIRKPDDIIMLFVERVKKAEEEAAVREVMVGQVGGLKRG